MKDSSLKIIDETLIRNNLIAVRGEIISALNCLIEMKGKVICCGNGGSSCDSEHIVGELIKSFRLHRPLDKQVKDKIAHYNNDLAERLQGAIPAVSLNSMTGIMTAVNNDMGGEYIFAQQALALCEKDDVFIGITTSGNSVDVVNAAIIAKAKGSKVIGLTGIGGGKLKEIADVTVAVPEKETYLVQEKHLPVYHLFCRVLENERFGL